MGSKIPLRVISSALTLCVIQFPWEPIAAKELLPWYLYYAKLKYYASGGCRDIHVIQTRICICITYCSKPVLEKKPSRFTTGGAEILILFT